MRKYFFSVFFFDLAVCFAKGKKEIGPRIMAAMGKRNRRYREADSWSRLMGPNVDTLL
jgi:hypothetical protein